MKFKLVETFDTPIKKLNEDNKIDITKSQIIGYINDQGVLVLPANEDEEDWEDWED